jgi:hypothetical protein
MDKAEALLMKKEVVEPVVLAFRMSEHPPFVKDDGPGHHRHEQEYGQDHLYNQSGPGYHRKHAQFHFAAQL